MALILALLIVAAVAAMATFLNRDFDRSVRFAENRLFSQQGNHLLAGGEAAAQFYLSEDLNDNTVDHLGEFWAQSYSFPLDIAVINLQLEDMQGRLNINELQAKVSSESRRGGAENFTVPQRRFIRLLQTFDDVLPLDRNEAIEITQAVIDWLDADDDTTGFGGAESIFYQTAGQTGYRPANREMTSTSELRLVKGVTPELYQLLEPLVCALPIGTELNVNTAPLAVLRTFNIGDQLTPLSLQDGEELLNERTEKTYDDIADFLDTPIMADLQAQATREGQVLSTDLLSVSTSYFMLRAQAVVAQRSSYSQSLLHRTPDTVRLISRELGNWQ
ncbi:type II secretion system minor pseudopilin GspK [bacterium SCSIO 12696]|nr:type II secretion system minor pseudopilin GspK [bacterium SCSIO 12696]